jgi:hypothetical protein
MIRASSSLLLSNDIFAFNRKETMALGKMSTKKGQCVHSST